VACRAADQRSADTRRDRPLSQGAGRSSCANGKGGKRREVGMDDWGWEHLEPWQQHRLELPRRGQSMPSRAVPARLPPTYHPERCRQPGVPQPAHGPGRVSLREAHTVAHPPSACLTCLDVGGGSNLPSDPPRARVAAQGRRVDMSSARLGL
jgi:hypothetical protein